MDIILLWLVGTATLTTLFGWLVGLVDKEKKVLKAILYLAIASAAITSSYFAKSSDDARHEAERKLTEANLSNQIIENQKLTKSVGELVTEKDKLAALNSQLKDTQTQITAAMGEANKQVKSLEDLSRTNFDLLNHKLDLAFVAMANSTVTIANLITGIQYSQITKEIVYVDSEDQYIKSINEFNNIMFGFKDIIDKNDRDTNLNILNGITYMLRYQNYKDSESRDLALKYFRSAFVKAKDNNWFGKNDKMLRYLNDFISSI